MESGQLFPKHLVLIGTKRVFLTLEQVSEELRASHNEKKKVQVLEMVIMEDFSVRKITILERERIQKVVDVLKGVI